jgi:hypothetical protein
MGLPSFEPKVVGVGLGRTGTNSLSDALNHLGIRTKHTPGPLTRNDLLSGDKHVDRPESLLVMDISAGDGWDVLCPFVGAPPPAVPFPHSNSFESAAHWHGRVAELWADMDGCVGDDRTFVLVDELAPPSSSSFGAPSGGSSTTMCFIGTWWLATTVSCRTIAWPSSTCGSKVRSRP